MGAPITHTLSSGMTYNIEEHTKLTNKIEELLDLCKRNGIDAPLIHHLLLEVLNILENMLSKSICVEESCINSSHSRCEWLDKFLIQINTVYKLEKWVYLRLSRIQKNKIKRTGHAKELCKNNLPNLREKY